VTGRDVDKEAIMGIVARDMSQADEDQLAGIQDAATKLLDGYGRFMGGTLVTYLATWREAAARIQARRAAPGAAVTPLAGKARRRAS
jgi:hypothetical protein